MHPVFPAIQAADGKRTYSVSAQAVPITRCPGEPFFIGGHQFAMDGLDGAFLVDIDQRAVQTVSASVPGPLDASQVIC